MKRASQASQLLFAACYALQTQISAQTMPAHLAIPVKVTTSKTPPSIRLDWKMPVARPFPIWVQRKLTNDTTWTMLAELSPTDTTFTDFNVQTGDAWEYLVRSPDLPLPNYWWRWVNGQVYAGIETPPETAPRGRVLFLVDASLTDPLASELFDFQQSMRGDGWQVVRQNVDTATATVPSVKALVRQFFEQDSTNSRTVLLFGNLPVPYSGFISPDGHSEDHRGAWPTDFYYADMQESPWTDTTDYWPQHALPRTQNHRNDGKFDPDQKPSLPELDVSRVDFSNLHDWGVPQTELYRRYLKKDLAFRSGDYRPSNRTLIDDEWRWAYQAGFAVNGYRNGHSLTGANSVVDGEWFQDSERDTFLFGWAGGGGSWSAADYVGSSADYIRDTVNVVFSFHFGSYFGDWDYPNNPFLPAALASKGGILTNAWGSWPNWHLHHMALGKPIAYSMNWLHRNAGLQRDNQVYCSGPYYFGIHIGMLGDLTLRLHYPKPPSNASLSVTCKDIKLKWKPSPEATHGYLIYRSPTADGVFNLLSQNPVLDTFFTDNAPLVGQNFYQIKTLKLENSPTGTYFNQSIGIPASAVFSPVSLAVSSQVLPVSCFGGQNGAVNLTVDGTSQNLGFQWSNGSVGQNLGNAPAGNYTVTISASGFCSTTVSVNIPQPAAPLDFSFSKIESKCTGENAGSISVSANGGTPNYSFEWSNGAVNPEIQNLSPGIYLLTISDANGCSQTADFQIIEPDSIQISLTVFAPTCPGFSNGSLSANASGGVGGFQFFWSNGGLASATSNLPEGNFSVTVADANGCTVSENIDVTAPQLPDYQIFGVDTICASSTAVYQFENLGSQFQWYLENPGGGQITTGQGSKEVSVSWFSPGLQTLSLAFVHGNGCPDTISLLIFVEGCVGVGEVLKPGIRLFPNPFSENLNLIFEKTPADWPVLTQVFDAAGCLVFENRILGNPARLELPGLPDGFYFLKILGAGWAGVWRVLKVRD